MIPARRYAREIESRWAALLERPVVFGERDWELICDWHARGIPLALVEEAFDQFAEKLKRRRRPPRNLGVVAPWVEDAWRTVRGGRIETEPASSPNGTRDPVLAWRDALAELAQDSPLRGLLQDLLDRLASGEPAAQSERTLRENLLDHLPDEARTEIELEVTKELELFRTRMALETWQATRDRAMVSAARRRLGLPVLIDP